MKATPECMACLFRQALNVGRIVSTDQPLLARLLRRVAAYAASASLDQTPARFSQPVYRFAAELAGVADPYREQKRATNAAALALLPRVRALVASAPDPLERALHAAVMGNVIDFGIHASVDVTSAILDVLERPFALTVYDRFRTRLGPGRNLLYLGDNAGEIVFDRLCVEHLLETGTEVVFAVKSGPILNDALREDAEAVGLADLVRVIETGGADIGVDWASVGAEFRAEVARADVILAKGHGNFETCCDRAEPFFFLLQAKCPVVADELRCRVGDLVFAAGAGAERKAE